MDIEVYTNFNSFIKLKFLIVHTGTVKAEYFTIARTTDKKF